MEAVWEVEKVRSFAQISLFKALEAEILKVTALIFLRLQNI